MDASDRRRLLHEGRDAFNRGAYFEAHELWEAVWTSLEGGERTTVQGLIQIAVGLLKLEQRRPTVAIRILTKGLVKLEGGAESIEGLDLARLARDARSALLASGSPRRPSLRLHLVSP